MAEVPYVYKGWSGKLEVLAATSWYELSDIINFMTTLKEQTTINAAVIQKLAGLLCALKRNAPFSRQARFYQDKYYVCELIPETKDALCKVAQLFNFLTTFDFDKYKTQNNQNNYYGQQNAITYTTNVNIYVDPKQLYEEFVNGVIEAKIPCYNGEKFEMDFGLEWTKKHLVTGSVGSSYTKWSVQVETLALTKWYNIKKLVKFVEGARMLDFLNEKTKANKIAFYHELLGPSPYSRNSRFVVDEWYICEIYFSQSTQLKTLYDTLSQSLAANMTSQQQNISKVRELAGGILSHLITSDKVFDRTSFEEMYGLVWT